MTTDHKQRGGPSLDGSGLAAVRAADRTAELIITVGGLSVIAAVLGIIAYLGYVTLPLLAPGSAEPAGVVERAGSDPAPLAVVLDEQGDFFLTVLPDGGVQIRQTRGGGVVLDAALPGIEQAAEIDRLTLDPSSGLWAAATDAGLIMGRAEMRSRTVGLVSVPPAAAEAEIGVPVADDRALFLRNTPEQWRRTTLELESLGIAEISPPAGGLLDIAASRNGFVAVAADDAGRATAVIARRARGGLDDEGGLRLRTAEFAAEAPGFRLAGLAVLDQASQVVLVAEDGRYERFEIGRSSASSVETGTLPGLLEDGQERVTIVGTVLGRGTFAVGTNRGRLATFFPAVDVERRDDLGAVVTGRSVRLPMSSAVSAMASSLRDRSMVIGSDAGDVVVWHGTSGKLIARASTGGGAAAREIAVAPKLDRLMVVTATAFEVFALDVGHPEATLSSVFLPIRYEGQPEADFVYQASSAEDDAEPKLSLMPLIFGTLKATVFAMLFAAPIAVLAAIYTSEFMQERHRRIVKPSIEMMASLPSVVLGFVAAMVVAPFIRDHLTTVLLSIVLVPGAVLLGAGLWSLLPDARAARMGPMRTLGSTLALTLLGVVLAAWSAPAVERSLFGPSEQEVAVLAGMVEPAEPAADGAFEFQGEWFVAIEPASEDERAMLAAVGAEFAGPGFAFKNWLGGVTGSAWSGWFAILAPMFAAVLGILIWPLLLRAAPAVSDARWQPVLRVVVSCAIGAALAGVLASILTSAGADARGGVLGPYTQRNTLVVGVIMGFAIIPIIYTISDDAMRSVPVSLKAASLGSGATPWQTVVRIVLPVAASGIFSAIMIGFGRAVGETMIVLMATGNTPVMEWNIFSGLRTLSANIAVELPEAERGGTHYRLLFLCGVVLFAMTFVINTSAEIVRQHFRKRNSML
ncbi:MAG: ABC transporter permease subunit [Planctomycetota bacterium]